ncbi:MAG TPA: hypothetical protein VMT53_05555 [Terriglobales bacterium]|nr:hypothetical protein [Terriglobales bacterium]
MALIVIGGHSRSVGKTSVVAGLIAALSEFHWTAIKITQYGHGICSKNGRACACATADHSWAISEEKDRSGKSDTSRFLVAGAESALWVRTQQGHLEEALPELRKRIAERENVICESNSLLRFIKPDLYLTVLDPGTGDFKSSAREYLELADAVILHEHPGPGAAWRDVSLEAAKPTFRIQPPRYVTLEISDFVRSRLRPASLLSS